MNVDNLAKLTIAMVAFLLLIAALKMWRKTVIEATKQTLFAIRADLFDAVEDMQKLNDPLYQETRWIINGLLRDIDSMTGMRWLYFAFLYWKNDGAENYSAADNNNEHIDKVVRETRAKIGKVIYRHFWICGLDGLIAMIVVRICVNAKQQIVRKVIAEAERVGKDDDYASGKHKQPGAFICA